MIRLKIIGIFLMIGLCFLIVFVPSSLFIIFGIGISIAAAVIVWSFLFLLAYLLMPLGRPVWLIFLTISIVVPLALLVYTLGGVFGAWTMFL